MSGVRALANLAEVAEFQGIADVRAVETQLNTAGHSTRGLSDLRVNNAQKFSLNARRVVGVKKSRRTTPRVLPTARTTVGIEVLGRQLVGWDQLVVPLVGDDHTSGLQPEREERNDLVAHELGADGTCNQVWKPLSAQVEILLNPDDAHVVIATLRLDRQPVVGT
jgi:hypothetical protein